MTRRAWAALLAGGLSAKPTFTVAPLTRGPKHHFFGYYGICPWNKSQKHLVCLESPFHDHLPAADEPAGVMLVDAKTGSTRKLTETRAWNLQQGAMLHWNPLKPETEIIFNERDGDSIISAAFDIVTGKRRTLPRAINGVSHNGRHAVCLTYGRLTRLRPVVGYVGAKDPHPDVAHPDDDGVFVMDLETGSAKLAVSIGEVYRRLVKKHPELSARHMWFNHTVFNKDDSRFFFLARCWETEPQKRLESAMFTCRTDGRDLREVIPFGKGVSHFEWRNKTEIMATFRLDGPDMKHVLFTDGKGDYKAVGEEFLKGDGHCSFAPDQQWIVTDRNVEKTISKQLMIYHIGRREGLLLGDFPMNEKRYLGSDTRCDLHPRWSRDGKQICFDAIAPDGTRQLHIAKFETI